ncbi:MAG: response regulator transcription factor [Methylococcaceae bacterium]
MLVDYSGIRPEKYDFLQPTKRMKKMKILIVCDHMLFRESIRRIFAQLDDKLDLYEESHLGTVVKKIDKFSDIEMMLYYTGQLGGAQCNTAIKNIHSHNPELSIVVLSESNNTNEINLVIEAGAKSYLSMKSTVEDLLNGLKKVLRGEKYISVSPVDSEIIEGGIGEENFNLSERQSDVLDMMLLGKSNKEIARSMEIGEGTVKSYCSIIYRKLDVDNRNQAIIRVKETEFSRI